MNAANPSYGNAPPAYDYAMSQGAQPMAGPSTDRTRTSNDNGDLSPSDVKILEDELNAIAPPLHHQNSSPRLPVPIAIPQIGFTGALSTPSPLLRAYAPVLSDLGLSKRDFLKVVDTMNICLSASPPFQALNVASMATGFVPSWIAQTVSAGTGVIAGVGTAATCYIRTRRFVEKANRDIFGPRGLKMTFIKDTEVLTVLQLSEQRVLEKMNAIGQAQTPGVTPDSIPRRRLRALEGKIADLDFDVPPPDNPGNILDKISAKQQARKAAKKDQKMHKRQRKADRKKSKLIEKYGDGTERSSISDLPPSNASHYEDDKSSSDSDDSDSSSIYSLQRKLTKAERKTNEVNQKYDEKLIGASEKKRKEIEKKRAEKLKDIEKDAKHDQKDLTKKQEKKYGKRLEKNEKREAKAMKKMSKLEWLVVCNIDEEISR